ncbi:uncharacterized protein [Palaemon carinicauda]|uniref:uncharacterized protein n=1 Tax=Palaemon carinicauda TaxID=392227 RepID=UPI0035B584AA
MGIIPACVHQRTEKLNKNKERRTLLLIVKRITNGTRKAFVYPLVYRLESMKEFLATLIFHGLLLMLALRTVSTQHLYGLTPLLQEDPFSPIKEQDHSSSKRGFWEKRSSEEDGESFENYVPQLQWTKRNFQEKKRLGTMMPAYLIHLYRPELSAVPQKSIFSPPRANAMREERSNRQ